MANCLFAICLAHKCSSFFSTTEVFICLKVINVFKNRFVDRPVPEKLDIFYINLIQMLFTKHSWRSGKCYVIGHVAILIPSFHESMTPLLWTKYEDKKTACRLTFVATQARVSTFWVEINFQKYLSIAKTTEKTVKTMTNKFPPWWWCHYIAETKRYIHRNIRPPKFAGRYVPRATKL